MLEIHKEKIEEGLGHARELKTIADQYDEIKKRLHDIVTDNYDFRSKADEITNTISELLSKVNQWESNN